MRLKPLVTFLDERFIRLLNMWGQASGWRFVIPKITRLGGATFTTAVVLSSIWFGNEELKRAGYNAALGLAGSTFISQLLKKWTKRFRPYQRSSEITVIGKPLIDPSFPSGHTTAIFSIVTAFSFFFPAFSVLLFAIAFLVGLSRVCLGLHYPTDVIAGMTLGILASVGSHAALNIL
ncbi:MAG: phosphatase family protein [Bacilli bacterium]|nr:phosphatase family protein [Bacilli bacterium]